MCIEGLVCSVRGCIVRIEVSILALISDGSFKYRTLGYRIGVVSRYVVLLMGYNPGVYGTSGDLLRTSILA